MPNSVETKCIQPFESASAALQDIVVGEPRNVKISRGGKDYILEESTPVRKQEMKQIARTINEIAPENLDDNGKNKITQAARETLDDIMEEYRQSLQKAIESDEDYDFDKLSRDAQIFIMLAMRKDGANAQMLEDFAEVTVLVFRDQIYNEQRDWKKTALAIGAGSIMVVASIVGASATFQGAKAISGIASFAIQGGQGVKGFESVFDSKIQATVSHHNASKDMAQSKKGQNSDQKRRADQALEAARRAAEQILQNRHQTVLVFVRNNY